MSEDQKQDDGNVVPMSRGGGAPVSRGGPAKLKGTPAPTVTMTEMEKNAPVFNSPKEYQQWLDGKPTRREVIADVKKLQEWSAYISARLEQVTEPLEALKTLLVKRGVISFEEYTAQATLQLNFKRVLDAINFTPHFAMTEKIQMARSWNEEHPEIKIVGAYIRGLKDFLKDPASGLTLMERAEHASELGIGEETVLTEVELSELAAQLAAPPVTADEAESDPEKAAELLAEAGLTSNEKEP